jgi:hypothetical protein
MPAAMTFLLNILPSAALFISSFTEGRPIRVEVEELPRNPVAEVFLRGTVAGESTPYELKIQRSSAEKETFVSLKIDGNQLPKVAVPLLNWNEIDFGSITTHHRRYPEVRVFRVRMRYGVFSLCPGGDDPRGSIVITFSSDRAAKVERRSPNSCQ